MLRRRWKSPESRYGDVLRMLAALDEDSRIALPDRNANATWHTQFYGVFHSYHRARLGASQDDIIQVDT